MSPKSRDIVTEAQKDFNAKLHWTKFSNKYMAMIFALSPSEREQFLSSEDFLTIENWKYELKKMDDEQNERVYSGKINIRIPKTLHRVLAKEAETEGTSLNQLIVAKLARKGF